MQHILFKRTRTPAFFRLKKFLLLSHRKCGMLLLVSHRRIMGVASGVGRCPACLIGAKLDFIHLRGIAERICHALH